MQGWYTVKEFNFKYLSGNKYTKNDTVRYYHIETVSKHGSCYRHFPNSLENIGEKSDCDEVLGDHTINGNRKYQLNNISKLPHKVSV